MITKHYKYIFAFIMLFMAIVSVALAWNDSLTFDEVAHIPAGYSYVTMHDYRLNPEHPPLLKILAGLAILPLHPHFDTSQDFWTTANNLGEYGQWTAGKHLLHQAQNNTDMIVFLARLPIVFLSLFCAAFLFFWGKKIGGIVTGLFAMILFAFDPNILGHNHFVTTDIGIAIAFACAFYYFLQFLKTPTWSYALFGGVALGIAQVTKFSAILLLPFFGILLITYPLITFIDNDQSRIKTFFIYIIKGIFALIIMVCVVWITYLPITYKMPLDVLPQIAHIKGQPDKYPRDRYLIQFIEYTNQKTILRPFATYTQGVMQVFNRVDDGNVTYFMGSVSNDASRWYFPFVFIAKQTLVHLFFYVTAFMLFALFTIRSCQKIFRQSLTQSFKKCRAFCVYRFHEISLGMFIMLYSYISITGNLNIGFRHLFPMMPLLYVLTAKTIIDSYKKLQDPKRKKIIRSIFIIIISILIITTISAYPFYMSYFNVLVGGSKNGYHYVTDSNADWGQDLKRLKIYLDAHPEIDKIRIDYFGGDDIHNRIGDGRYILWWDNKRPIEPGHYALSTFFIQESIFTKDRAYDDSYQWTRELTPIDQVGTSFLIYKVE